MKTLGKTSFKIAALVVLSWSAISGATEAQAAPGERSAPGAQRGAHMKKADHLAGKLGLSESQKAQIKTIREGARSRAENVKNDAALPEAQKRQLLQEIRQSTRSAISSVLTPEQRAQWKEFKSEKKEHREEWAQLGLSATQIAQIKSIRQRSRTDSQAVKNDSALSPEQKRAQLQTIRSQVRQAIDALLTPEQRTKLQQMRDERRQERRQQRRQGRGNKTPQTNGGLNG